MPDARFELTDRNDTGARIERVVEAVEAVEECYVSLLEECDDLLLHGGHPLRLGRAEMLGVDSLLPLEFFVRLLPELGQLVTLRLVLAILFCSQDFLLHLHDNFSEGAIEVIIVNAVPLHVNSCRTWLTCLRASASLDGISSQQVLVRFHQSCALGRKEVIEFLRCYDIASRGLLIGLS